MPKLKRKTYRMAKVASEMDICLAETYSEVDVSSNASFIEQNESFPKPFLFEKSHSEPSQSAQCYFEHSYSEQSFFGSSNESDIEILKTENIIGTDCRGNIGEKSLGCELAEWAVKCNIHHTAISDLLGILKKHHPNLPSDPRTLLKTPRTDHYKVKLIPPGTYYHFGLKNCIEELLYYEPVQNLLSVEICINIDGLPISKNSGSKFYPILCNLVQNKNVVRIIVLYHG